MQLQPSWQLEPVSATARLWLLALAVLLPMGIIAGTLVYTANAPTPKNLLADHEALTIAHIIGGTLLLCLPIHWVIIRAMRRHQITHAEYVLAVRTTLYSPKLGWGERC